jgi:hypothetical protein
MAMLTTRKMRRKVLSFRSRKQGEASMTNYSKHEHMLLTYNVVFVSCHSMNSILWKSEELAEVISLGLMYPLKIKSPVE